MPFDRQDGLAETRQAELADIPSIDTDAGDGRADAAQTHRWTDGQTDTDVQMSAGCKECALCMCDACEITAENREQC